MDIPVARRCNIKCNYCNREYDCPNDNEDRVSSKVLSPTQTIKKLRNAVTGNSRLTVIGIAGPGEPLANKETFETLKLINRENPHLIKCLSTNGLLLPDKMDELVELGVDALKVTINATDPETASFIYSWIHYKGEEYTNTDGASILLRNQLEGIRLAVKRGIVVQVNFILIPGINENIVSDAGGQQNEKTFLYNYGVYNASGFLIGNRMLARCG